MDTKSIYVTGGTFLQKNLEKKKDILDNLHHLGNQKDWLEAIALFEATHDYTRLEKVADEYIIDFLRARSTQTFSPAPLFSYFTKLKNNAQTIGAVMVAKRSGISEKELRTILRSVYT